MKAIYLPHSSIHLWNFFAVVNRSASACSATEIVDEFFVLLTAIPNLLADDIFTWSIAVSHIAICFKSCETDSKSGLSMLVDV